MVPLILSPDLNASVTLSLNLSIPQFFNNHSESDDVITLSLNTLDCFRATTPFTRYYYKFISKNQILLH